MKLDQYFIPALFIICSGLLVLLWVIDKRKGKVNPFPWRYLCIFAFSITVVVHEAFWPSPEATITFKEVNHVQ